MDRDYLDDDQPITVLDGLLVNANDKVHGRVESFNAYVQRAVDAKLEKKDGEVMMTTKGGIRLHKNDAAFFKDSYLNIGAGNSESAFIGWGGWCFVDLDHVDDVVSCARELHMKLSKYPYYKGLQLSFRGEGIHAVFYKDPVEYSIYEYYAFVMLCYNNVFCEIDPKYIDYHNFEHHQPLLQSKFKFGFNKNFSSVKSRAALGLWSDGMEFFESVCKYDEKAQKVMQKSPLYEEFKFRAKNEIANWFGTPKVDGDRRECVEDYGGELKFVKDGMFHLSYDERFKIACCVCRIYGDGWLKVWEYVMQFQTDGKSGHNHDFYVRQFKDLANKKNIFLNRFGLKFLIDNFGLEIKDDVIHMAQNEFMYDNYKSLILNKIEPKGFHLIIAGTGTGKTEFWKKLNAETAADPLAIHDKPILVIEPYSSIVRSKYDDGESVKAVGCGVKDFDNKMLDGTKLYVTNFWHLNNDMKNYDGSEFRYVVLDESHLISKEKYRSDDLVASAKVLRRFADNTSVVLQTATATDEAAFFGDDELKIDTLKFKKDTGVSVSYEMCHFVGDWQGKESLLKKNHIKKDAFQVAALGGIARKMLAEGRKVYIYYSNIDTKLCDEFAELNRDLKIAIYHKKAHEGNERVAADMDYINTWHELGERYDVLLSSVYFGVGNDLNDDCKAACIIVGNNPWQEDVQVWGRWRKSKDIKVVNIFKKPEEERYSTDYYDTILERKRATLWNNYQDMSFRTRTLAIKGYNIQCAADTKWYAIIDLYNDWYANIDIKIRAFEKYGVKVNKQIYDYVYGYEDADEIGAFNGAVKEERKSLQQITIERILNGEEPEWNDRDNRVKNWQSAVYRFYKEDAELFKEMCDEGGGKWIRSFAKTKTINLFLRMCKMLKGDGIDAAELRCLEFFRQKMKEVDKNNGQWMDEEMGISWQYFYKSWAYVYFYHYKTINDPDWVLQGDYFDTFKNECASYLDLDPKMLAYLMDSFYKVEYPEVKDDSNLGVIDYLEKFIDANALVENKFDVDNVAANSKFGDNIIEKCVCMLRRLISDKVEKNKRDVRKRPVEIDGVEYNSIKEAAAMCKVNMRTVRRWIESGKAKLI